MSIIDTIDGIMRDVADLTNSGVGRLTDLETTYDDHTFVLRDGGFATFLNLRGHRMLVGHEEFYSALNALSDSLNGVMMDQGHTIAVHYRYDPFDKRIIERCRSGMRSTSQTMGLDMGDVIDDWADAVEKYTRGETMVLVLYTRLNVLTSYARKSASKEMTEGMLASPFIGPSWDSQRVGRFSNFLADQHRAFVDSIMQTLAHPAVSLIADRMNVWDAMKMMRMQLAPAETGDSWRATLPGDRLPIRLEDTTDGFKQAPMRYQSIARQLFTADRDIFKSTGSGGLTVRWNNVYHRAITVDVPPLGETSFNRLFENMTTPDYAWNLSFHIDGGGLQGMSLKSSIAAVLMPLSPDNGQIHRAMKWLTELRDKSGRAIVRLRMTIRMESKSEAVLDQAVSEMLTRLSAWKSCSGSVPVGTAQSVACAATVPGLMSKSPSPASAAPLIDVVSMLPWTRPADIWDSGMPMRTVDGKAFPWMQGSSLQNAFIDVGIGPMGAGKSVNLNAINLGFVLTPGLVRLPMLSILDIGPSSRGLILSLQDSLPPDQKHLATYVRLKMDPARYSVNVFDLPVGLEKPLPLHSDFLVNLLTLFDTPLGGTPPAYAPGLSRMLIDQAYKKFSPKSLHAKLYSKGVDGSAPDCLFIDARIDELGVPVDGHTTWHDLARYFFDKGLSRESEICCRYAAPILSEVLAMTNDRAVVETYKEEATHEYWRTVTDAIKAYPILNGYTRFSLAGARVVSLDMDEVAIKGSPVADRQSGVMFMVARHLLISRFFIQETDVEMFDEHFRDHYRREVRNMRTDPKRIVFDELHRFVKKDNPVVSQQVVSDVSTIQRESRKWNIHLGMYSQDPEDIPADLAGMVTTTFIMGVNGSEAVAIKADNRFSFGDTARKQMVSALRKPGRSGSHMITRMMVNGQVVTRHLMNTLGPVLLWTLTSTTEDALMVSRLYERYGGRIARRALAAMYPGGTIKDTFESMRIARSEGRYLSEDDRRIYEKLSHTAREGIVDTLDVIYEKAVEWIEAKRTSNPSEWS